MLLDMLDRYWLLIVLDHLFVNIIKSFFLAHDWSRAPLLHVNGRLLSDVITSTWILQSRSSMEVHYAVRAAVIGVARLQGA